VSVLFNFHQHQILPQHIRSPTAEPSCLITTTTQEANKTTPLRDNISRVILLNKEVNTRQLLIIRNKATRPRANILNSQIMEVIPPHILQLHILNKGLHTPSRDKPLTHLNLLNRRTEPPKHIQTSLPILTTAADPIKVLAAYQAPMAREVSELPSLVAREVAF
jgi:hypothetical protein